MSSALKFCLIALMILLLGCDESREGNFYRVQRVYDNNSIQLEDNTIVVLIGVKGSQQTREFLDKHVVGNEVKLVFDKSNREKQKQDASKIFAYVLVADFDQQIMPCVNSTILMQKLSELYQGTNLTDSLEIYSNYADDWVTYPPAENASRKKFDRAELIRKIEPSIFYITAIRSDGSKSSQGTGFFISQTQGITNHHVVAGASKIIIETNKGEKILVSNLGAVNETFDFAVLEFDMMVNHPPLRFSRMRVEKGEDILVFGHPRGLKNTVSNGIVSEIRSLASVDDLIQITASVSPGNSGGPVVNMYGEVIGIVTFKIRDCENCNFAFSSIPINGIVFGAGQGGVSMY